MRYGHLRLALFAVLCLLVPLLASPPISHAQSRERCFDATGFCVQDPILAYWEKNGGLAVFGYPITDLHEETIEGSWTGPVQWFERDRLEDHSTNRQGVLAGRLGATILELQGRPWTNFPKVSGVPKGCRLFVETGHSLCGSFLSYWEKNGGLTRFGFPITEPFDEVIGDWAGTVQYFERRRMEQHPENSGTAYEILLGLLGHEVLNFKPPFDTSGWIVFTSTRTGDQEIWKMRGDGTSPVNLTNNSASGDFQPSVSANGTRIAYVVGTQVTQSQDIWIMNADGSNKRQLTSDPSAEWGPTLSPDGSKVAFVSDRTGNADIFVMNTDGSGEAVNLTSFGSGTAQFAPAWSPDATRIAFVSDEAGSPNIWIMRADGSERYNLTNNLDNRYNNPSWTRDSARVVYDVNPFYDYTSSSFNIAMINTDGTERRPIIFYDGVASNPTISAGGASIAFEHEGDIYVMGLDGGEGKNLTNSLDSVDRDACWTP